MNENQGQGDTTKAKKVYKAPVLHEYGGIQALTQNGGKASTKGDGGMGNTKTT